MSTLRPSLLLSLFALAASSLSAGEDKGSAVMLDSVVVMAGQLPTGDQPAAVMRANEVALTPGANADIGRALQTFPGVQLVDDGNALFVRGGSSVETITRLNGLYFPSSLNLNTPTGTFTSTLNAYEARRIDFAVGGFDARFGNSLSAIVDIDTVGAPHSTVASLGVSLGSLSLATNVALTNYLGVRLSVSRNTTGPFFDLNGSTRDFAERPNGREAALTIAAPYRKGGEIKLFVTQRRSEFIVGDPQAGVQSSYSQSDLMRFAALSWKDSFGNWTIQASAGGGDTRRIGTASLFNQTIGFEHRQFSSVISYRNADWVSLSGGFDALHSKNPILNWLSPTLGGAGLFQTDVSDTRWGAFAKADVALARNVRAVFSARTDESTLTHEQTVDPRFSIAWEPRKRLTFSAAAGVYHQIPSAYDFIDFYHGGRQVVLPASSDRQAILCMQIGRGIKMLRVEAYTKRYSDLVAFNRSYISIPGGSGQADGVDLYVKHPLPAGITSRVTYGFVNTRRTDPNTGRMAAAPFDVHHSLSVILEKTIAGWDVGASWRCASGKPLTPIVGASRDAFGSYHPIYGDPYSERLPPIQKLDLMISHFWKTGERTSLIVYATLSNALNRENTYTYGYTNNYTTRFPVPSMYNRSVFFGCTLQFY